MATDHAPQSLLGRHIPEQQRERRISDSSSTTTRNSIENDQHDDYMSEEASAVTARTQPDPPTEPNISHANVHSTLLSTADNDGGDAYACDEKAQEAQLATWHPFWLRQTVFGIFFLLFVSFAIALSLMLFYSKRNNGLVESSPGFAYAWRFIPTAIFTVVGILWSRVEFQALQYMPWIAIKSEQPLDTNIYNLDYTSMLSPVVLIQSLKRKHYFVFLISLVSIILKIQVVLSASLCQLELTQTSQPVQVEVLDSFNTTEDLFKNGQAVNLLDEDEDKATGIGAGMFPYYNALAIEKFGVTLPFGVSKEGAYRAFKMIDRGTTTRGTVSMPLTVVVDGAFMDMKCLNLEGYSSSIKGEEGDDVTFNVHLEFENCDQSVSIEKSISIFEPDDMNFKEFWSIETKLKNKHPCSALPQQNPSFVYFGGMYVPSSQKKSMPRLKTSKAILCSPTAWLSKVKIVDNGVNTKFTVLPKEKKVAVKSNPLYLLQNSFPNSAGSLTTGAQSSNLTLGGLVALSGLSFNESGTLLEEFVNLTGRMNPFLSHYLLRETGKPQLANGSIMMESYRLHINEASCYPMAGLFVITLCITLWAVFQSGKKLDIWYRDPATILETLLFFKSNTKQSKIVAANMEQERKRNKAQWSNSSYSPIVLRLWARSTSTVLVLVVIVIVSITLRKSDEHGGLVIDRKGGYWLFLWTSLPTFIMLCISLYIGSTDTAIRSLATILRLSSSPCSSRDLDLSLADSLGIVALYHSFRLKILAISVSQSLAILCAFLTSLSAILFTTQTIPKITESHLEQDSWFGSRPPPKNMAELEKDGRIVEALGSFLLTKGLSNFTWPQNTYADLAFPTLRMSNIDWDTNISVKVQIPAAKVAQTCIQLSEDDFGVSVDTVDTTTVANFTQYFKCLNGTSRSLLNRIEIKEPTVEIDGVFQGTGVSYVTDILQTQTNLTSLSGRFDCDPDPDKESDIYISWGLQTYIWGKFSFSTMEFDHISIWRCNYSWSEVMADVRLIWENDTVQIDHQDPPVQSTSTPKPWNPPFVFPLEVLDVFSDTYPEVRLNVSVLNKPDGLFSLLVEPFGSIPADDFGNPDKDDTIMEAINSYIGIMGGQLANARSHLRFDEKSAGSPARHGDLSMVKATITNYGRYGLVQSPGITFALVGILSLVLLIHIWALTSTLLRRVSKGKVGWLLNLDLEGLAPENFVSIASMESLLHGSNALNNVPKDPQLMPSSVIHERLSKRRFRLGWFQDHYKNEKEFTVGALDDEEFEFLDERKDIDKTERDDQEGNRGASIRA